MTDNSHYRTGPPPAPDTMPDLAASPRLGRAFTAQSDLLPLFLLRYDRENTRRAYRRDLLTFFGSEVITLEMAAEVTFPDVNAALARMETDGKSPATQKRMLASLRGFFSWLTALGFIDLNPADRHLVRRIPKQSGALVTVLTREQAGRLLGAIDWDRPTAARDHALVTVLLNCVLRRSEAAAMDVEDLHQSGPHTVLRIRRAKGGANQTVKVPAKVSETVRSFVESQGYASGPVWRSFSNRTLGRRLSGTSVYKIVRTLGERAGLPDGIGAHTLRHTGCTLAIENGASLQQVQTHARHKSIETTMRYVHQRDKLANSAADFIDL